MVLFFFLLFFVVFFSGRDPQKRTRQNRLDNVLSEYVNWPVESALAQLHVRGRLRGDLGAVTTGLTECSCR